MHNEVSTHTHKSSQVKWALTCKYHCTETHSFSTLSAIWCNTTWHDMDQVSGLCLRHHIRAARWKHPGMLLTMANVLTFSWPSNDSRNNTALWGKREPPVVEGAGRRRWACGRVRRGEEKTEKWGQRRWWGIRKGDYQVEEHMEGNACAEGEVMGGERLKRKVGISELVIGYS